jgi:DNA polymerase-3 subunit delta'
MRETPRAGLAKLADTHAELVRLGAQAPTYNFDPSLLVMEIGTLLARVAAPSEPTHG